MYLVIFHHWLFSILKIFIFTTNVYQFQISLITNNQYRHRPWQKHWNRFLGWRWVPSPFKYHNNVHLYTLSGDRHIQQRCKPPFKHRAELNLRQKHVSRVKIISHWETTRGRRHCNATQNGDKGLDSSVGVCSRDEHSLSNNRVQLSPGRQRAHTAR